MLLWEGDRARSWRGWAHGQRQRDCPAHVGHKEGPEEGKGGHRANPNLKLQLNQVPSGVMKTFWKHGGDGCNTRRVPNAVSSEQHGK